MKSIKVSDYVWQALMTKRTAKMAKNIDVVVRELLEGKV
jgi:hypothetical protein